MFQDTTSLRIPPPFPKDTNFPSRRPLSLPNLWELRPQTPSPIPWAKHKIRHLRLLQMVTTQFSGSTSQPGKRSGHPQTSKYQVTKKYNCLLDLLCSICGVISAVVMSNQGLEIHRSRPLV